MRHPSIDPQTSAVVNALVVLLLALVVPFVGQTPEARVEGRPEDSRPWGCRSCPIPMPSPDVPPMLEPEPADL